jgi:YD repeat-containing protein
VTQCRVTAETCNGRTVTSDYDAAGRLVRRVAPSGSEARWAYDRAGRPMALLTDGHALRFRYDGSGRETARDLPGGLRVTKDWDTTGQLTAQTLLSPGDRGALLQRRAYSYRGDGCLTGAADLLSGPRELTLDPAGRVTAITGPGWAEQYAYDPAGNITLAAWPALPGLPAPWQDVQGPREYAGTWQYTWDADSRLTAVTTPDGTAWRYAYDPLGRRIAKQRLDRAGQATEQTDFTWDGPVMAEQAPLLKLTRSVSGKAARYQAPPAWSRTRKRSAI